MTDDAPELLGRRGVLSKASERIGAEVRRPELREGGMVESEDGLEQCQRMLWPRAPDGDRGGDDRLNEMRRQDRIRKPTRQFRQNIRRVGGSTAPRQRAPGRRERCVV